MYKKIHSKITFNNILLADELIQTLLIASLLLAHIV